MDIGISNIRHVISTRNYYSVASDCYICAHVTYLKTLWGHSRQWDIGNYLHKAVGSNWKRKTENRAEWRAG